MRTSRLLSRLSHERYRHSPLSYSIAHIHGRFPNTEQENPNLEQNTLGHSEISCHPRLTQLQRYASFRSFVSSSSSSRVVPNSNLILPGSSSCNQQRSSSCNQQLPPFTRGIVTGAKKIKEKIEVHDHGQRAVTTALWCNFLVFSLKFSVWLSTSSHVMLAEVVHSVADFANQALLAYGLSSSRRGPDALHPYGYSKERFVWSLISAVGIFCLGSGATIVHGVQNLWTAQAPEHIEYAALVIGGSFIIEGVSLYVAIHAVRKGAAAEGMKVRDYVWRGHDPTSVAVMTEDGAAVIGLAIAAASLVAVNKTGNAIYDPIGSIVVGNLLGMVAIFLIQRNRHALIGRAIDDNDMKRVLHFLENDSVVEDTHDSKSEVIGPGFFRFKAEIDFRGEALVQNYLRGKQKDWAKKEEWVKKFREASKEKDDSALVEIMSNYGEEVVTALGSEVDRLEKGIKKIVPGIKHVDIEAHNPQGDNEANAPEVDIEAHNPQGDNEANTPEVDIEAHNPQGDNEANTPEVDIEAHNPSPKENQIWKHIILFLKRIIK